MAAKKLNNFFEGHRRKARLRTWTHLPGIDISRIKLELSIPVLGESFVGMNAEFSDPFTVMAKDESTMGRTPLDIELGGMTIEFFSTTDTQASKIPAVSSTNCKMVKFALVPSGEGEKRTIELQCVAYAPASIQLRDWAWELNHKEFGMEAVQSQTEMFEDEDEPEEEEEMEAEEEEEEDELAAVDASSEKPGRNHRVPLSDSSARKIRSAVN